MLFGLIAALAQAATVCPAGCDYMDANTAIAAGGLVELGDGVWNISNLPITTDVTIQSMNPGMAQIQSNPNQYAFVLDAPITFNLQSVSFGENVEGRILRSRAAATVNIDDVHALEYNPEGHLIKLEQGGLFTMTNSTFTGFMHIADTQTGGAVLWAGGGADVTVTNVDIDGGAGWWGGAIVIYDAVAVFDDVSITNAAAINSGGGILVESAGDLTVTNSTFDANQAGVGGGHIFSGGTLDVQNSSFANGRADGIYDGGGAISGAENVDNCTFTDNSAINSGGAVHGRSMTIDGSTFTGNWVDYGIGGAVRVDVTAGPRTAITNSDFVNNDSMIGYGGAIATQWNAGLELRDSELTGNDAEAGGAVYRQGNASDMLSNNRFEQNTARTWAGGAVAITYSSSSSIIEHSTFIGNQAPEGGAVYLTGGNGEIRNSAFCGNDAIFGGGGVYAQFAGGYPTGVTVTNSVFDGNGAGDGGAAMAASNVGPLLIVNNDFLDNEAFGIWGSALTMWQANAIDMRNNLFGWNTGGTAAAWADGALGSPISDYNLYWQNGPADVAGDSLSNGANDLFTDPLLTDYAPDMGCGNWDLTPLPDSPVIDGGDPGMLDANGSNSDIGVTGGPGSDTDPGWDTNGDNANPYGDPATTNPPIDADGDGFDTTADCDDNDPNVHPDAIEVVNDRIDNDCDGKKATSWLGGRACDQSGGSAPWAALLVVLLAARRRFSA